MAISISFPFSWAAQPGAWRPSLSGCCFSQPYFVSKLVWSPKLIRGSRGPLLPDAAFRSPNSLIGGLRAPSAGCWLSIPHLVSNSSDPQLLLRGSRGPLLLGSVFSTASFSNSLISNWWNYLCIEIYNSTTATQYLPITGHRNMHFRRLWNGRFDRHRAEITVMQFTGHSLPVHQFVTVLCDFNPVPYCQPSSSARSYLFTYC